MNTPMTTKESEVDVRYPLDIENCGGDTYIVCSKGHHDPHAFMAAVRAGGYSWPLGFPTHHWVKRVPVPSGWTEELGYCDAQYVFVKEGTRGAYPATYSHEAYGDDAYENVAARTALRNAGVKV